MTSRFIGNSPCTEQSVQILPRIHYQVHIDRHIVACAGDNSLTKNNATLLPISIYPIQNSKEMQTTNHLYYRGKFYDQWLHIHLQHFGN